LTGLATLGEDLRVWWEWANENRGREVHSCKGWSRRVASVALCGLLGTVLLPATAAHAAGGVKFAVVGSNGALIRGNGVLSSSRLDTGTYQVNFNSNLLACAYVATVGTTSSGSISNASTATVAQRAGLAKSLFIQTFGPDGALADLSFHVDTKCGALQRFAVIGSTATIVRGSHVVSTTPLGTGNYEVIFDSDIHKCAFNASIGTTSDGTTPPGLITLAGRAGNLNGVFVHTMNVSGTATNYNFHLTVDCGNKRVISVINADGTKARAKNFVSSQLLSTGNYEVIFNRDVTACSYIATIGTTVNGGSILVPVAITTASRAGNANGVFLTIHNVSGTAENQPFHLLVTC
jgi:hypothetical protein